MKKIVTIFMIDLKIATKDPISLWIVFAPLLLASIIVWLTPGINDTALQVGILHSNTDMIDYFRQITKVETFDNQDQLIQRVKKRDSLIGLVSHQKTGQIHLLAQGNEGQSTEDMAKLLVSLYQHKAKRQDSRAKIFHFGKTTSPVQHTLGAILLMMVTALTGMIIAIGIVEDKTANTLRAVNVSPLTQRQYLLGKSLIGIILLFFCSSAILLILGLTAINWFQLLATLLISSLIAIVLGFLMGVTSSDFIEAAGAIKILMLPMIASILVYQLAPTKWHFTVYWSPFYWSYKSVINILEDGQLSWSSLLINHSFILLFSLIVYLAARKQIRQKLN